MGDSRALCWFNCTNQPGRKFFMGLNEAGGKITASGTSEFRSEEGGIPPKLTLDNLHPQSPTFLTPGTGFTGDNFSRDWGEGDGFRLIQMHYIYCALYF